jgi:hypothetical protein
MKFSENTIALLKNFATINNSIVVKKGNVLRTISLAKNILAEVEIEEKFSRDFAIYDLIQFLNGLALHKNPDLDFTEDNYVLIQEDKRRVKYFYSDPNVITSPPNKKVQLPSKDVCFQLDSQILEKLIKASSVYQLPDLSVIGNDGVIRLVVRDKRNSSSNEYSIVVGETVNDFVFNFRVENIKIIPGQYDVIISKELLSQFVHSNYKLCYWITLESDSTFE